MQPDTQPDMEDANECLLRKIGRERGNERWSIDVNALWSGTNKNRDVSTGPLARPFARGKVNY